MKILVGDTGLVGTTLSENIGFDIKFNRSNIHDFDDKVIDGSELYLSCLPATKWVVNQNPIGDFENMMRILNVIKTKKYSKVILISTIDIYNSSPLQSNEDYIPQLSNFNYGNNRYLFEIFVKEMVKTDNLKIFRLPALFNRHIKKKYYF